MSLSLVMKTDHDMAGQSSPAPLDHHRLTGNRPVQFLTAPVPFTRHEASARGISPYRLRTDSRYVQLTRGIWIDTQPETSVIAPLWADHQWLRKQMHVKAMLKLDDEVAGCNLTAARLYGLPLPAHLNERSVHVVTPALNASMTRPGVALHRYKELRTSSFFDLPLISVPQLFVELAPILNVAELTTLGEAAIGPWHGEALTSLSSLRREVTDRDRIHDRKTTESALEMMREGVDSPRETWLRLWLINHGFPEPVIHPAIRCSVVPGVLHPDLGYPEKKVAIEYEGDHHRSSDAQFAADNRRLEALNAAGWTVLRVSKKTNMMQFARILKHHLT
ncbi:Protein of unknown function (DUF559) [Brevibacterium antiquum]|uniref:DUF559 domain-containing protein n=3 Tax=Brevibacterium antiquum TaxID=234835 RepID=A0A2H1JPK1_9MICO|nr:Protein of unknown function (DUF559) [Brevibacterium antiquum]SMX89426.1 Protein of unknown function (DUF559) [Brevibacterium antiquum CNRZ 918]